MVTLIRGGDVFAPESLGRKDILLAGGAIEAVAEPGRIRIALAGARPITTTGALGLESDTRHSMNPGASGPAPSAALTFHPCFRASSIRDCGSPPRREPVRIVSASKTAFPRKREKSSALRVCR